MYLVFGVLLLGGLSFAMSNASILGSVVERGRWLGMTGGNVTTEGGNITGVNLNGSTLTDRWAAFYGNVSGNIRLTDSVGTNNVYTWAWNDSSGGSVCFSEGNFAWASAATATGAQVDTAFALGTVADNAAGTFTDAAACGLNFTNVAVVDTSAKVTHTSPSTFWTCAIKDTGAAKADFAFCTNMSTSTAGKNWNNEAANYEIMVPTTPGLGTETYYAFAQLN